MSSEESYISNNDEILECDSQSHFVIKEGQDAAYTLPEDVVDLVGKNHNKASLRKKLKEFLKYLEENESLFSKNLKDLNRMFEDENIDDAAIKKCLIEANRLTDYFVISISRRGIDQVDTCWRIASKLEEGVSFEILEIRDTAVRTALDTAWRDLVKLKAEIRSKLKSKDVYSCSESDSAKSEMDISHQQTRNSLKRKRATYRYDSYKPNCPYFETNVHLASERNANSVQPDNYKNIHQLNNPQVQKRKAIPCFIETLSPTKFIDSFVDDLLNVQDIDDWKMDSGGPLPPSCICVPLIIQNNDLAFGDVQTKIYASERSHYSNSQKILCGFTYERAEPQCVQSILTRIPYQFIEVYDLKTSGFIQEAEMAAMNTCHLISSYSSIISNVLQSGNNHAIQCLEELCVWLQMNDEFVAAFQGAYSTNSDYFSLIEAHVSIRCHVLSWLLILSQSNSVHFPTFETYASLCLMDLMVIYEIEPFLSDSSTESRVISSQPYMRPVINMWINLIEKTEKGVGFWKVLSSVINSAFMNENEQSRDGCLAVEQVWKLVIDIFRLQLIQFPENSVLFSSDIWQVVNILLAVSPLSENDKRVDSSIVSPLIEPSFDSLLEYGKVLLQRIVVLSRYSIPNFDPILWKLWKGSFNLYKNLKPLNTDFELKPHKSFGRSIMRTLRKVFDTKNLDRKSYLTLIRDIVSACKVDDSMKFMLPKDSFQIENSGLSFSPSLSGSDEFCLLLSETTVQFAKTANTSVARTRVLNNLLKIFRTITSVKIETEKTIFDHFMYAIRDIIVTLLALAREELDNGKVSMYILTVISDMWKFCEQQHCPDSTLAGNLKQPGNHTINRIEYNVVMLMAPTICVLSLYNPSQEDQFKMANNLALHLKVSGENLALNTSKSGLDSILPLPHKSVSFLTIADQQARSLCTVAITSSFMFLFHRSRISDTADVVRMSSILLAGIHPMLFSDELDDAIGCSLMSLVHLCMPFEKLAHTSDIPMQFDKESNNTSDLIQPLLNSRLSQGGPFYLDVAKAVNQFIVPHLKMQLKNMMQSRVLSSQHSITWSFSPTIHSVATLILFRAGLPDWATLRQSVLNIFSHRDIDLYSQCRTIPATYFIALFSISSNFEGVSLIEGYEWEVITLWIVSLISPDSLHSVYHRYCSAFEEPVFLHRNVHRFSVQLHQVLSNSKIVNSSLISLPTENENEWKVVALRNFCAQIKYIWSEVVTAGISKRPLKNKITRLVEKMVRTLSSDILGSSKSDDIQMLLPYMVTIVEYLLSPLYHCGTNSIESVGKCFGTIFLNTESAPFSLNPSVLDMYVTFLPEILCGISRAPYGKEPIVSWLNNIWACAGLLESKLCLEKLPSGFSEQLSKQIIRGMSRCQSVPERFMASKFREFHIGQLYKGCGHWSTFSFCSQSHFLNQMNHIKALYGTTEYFSHDGSIPVPLIDSSSELRTLISWLENAIRAVMQESNNFSKILGSIIAACTAILSARVSQTCSESDFGIIITRVIDLYQPTITATVANIIKELSRLDPVSQASELVIEFRNLIMSSRNENYICTIQIPS